MCAIQVHLYARLVQLCGRLWHDSVAPIPPRKPSKHTRMSEPGTKRHVTNDPNQLPHVRVGAAGTTHDRPHALGGALARFCR